MENYYTQYLNSNINNLDILSTERKKCLQEISRIRGNQIIVMSADLINRYQQLVSINYQDLMPFLDQLSYLSGDSIDFIIETPGGSGETVEEIVKIIRTRFKRFSIIVPGHAMSAGTLLAMAADEILMGELSALGPIDAQIFSNGKMFSADALINGFEGIKKEVEDTGKLNQAYIPILQSLSPGELEHARNAYDFAKILVTEWLTEYKFKDWNIHSSTGKKVTPKEKKDRANEIAKKLADHSNWKTHSRAFKVQDLQDMRLKITDYRDNPELCEYISRYYTLMQMTFDFGIYKYFETANSQIYKVGAKFTPPVQNNQPDSIEIDYKCAKCKKINKLQGDFKEGIPLKSGNIKITKNNIFYCQHCKTKNNILDLRNKVELDSKRKIL